MQVYDIKSINSYPYKDREKNVLFKSEEFKVRIIDLKKGEQLPTCEMNSYVIFINMDGKAEVMINSDKVTLKEGQFLVSEPATFSMTSENGVKMLGIQIEKRQV